MGSPETFEDKSAPGGELSRIKFADICVKMLNFFHFIYSTRKGSNFRYANYLRNALCYIGEFSRGQFYKVYGQYTAQFKYHPLQRFGNAIRRFNPSPRLAEEMRGKEGTGAFYRAVTGQTRNGFTADLTMLREIQTVKTSGRYLCQDIGKKKGERVGKVARDAYERGYSRILNVTDDADWDKFRTELRNNKHLGSEKGDDPENVMLVAVSYKGKERTLTRNMSQLYEVEGKNGKKKEKETRPLTTLTKEQMTEDFVEDFRWSQLIRSCKAIARKEGKLGMRLWIDRLVGMGKPPDKKGEIYEDVEWEDFGMFAYAVCPVVRLYNMAEPYFGTDFWRKLEMVMAVAGRGLVVDDYMLRKFDNTIYYGPKLYQQVGHGLSTIGGDGIYLRCVTLAVATAIVTDGVSTARVNEDFRTRRAVSCWKAWALRTIAEGAYSQMHSSMMMLEEDWRPFVIGQNEFLTIAFWESMVSRCESLTGNSYLDMSYQKSTMMKLSSRWDGIVEWVGMVPSACEIGENDRNAIMEFLTEQTKLNTWITTTNHAASILTLRSSDMRDKRAIVANLSRFSTAKTGHVTSIAEGTGLWKGKVLPVHLRHIVDPDEDQEAKINNNVDVDGVGILFTYNQMKVEFTWMKYVRIFFALVAFVLAWAILTASSKFIFVSLFISAIMLWFVSRIFLKWPWKDKCDVGEALFDNLLLHSLYKSGIKSHFRQLQAVSYNQIEWI